MGRGRAKAKQTKVARQLKYSSPEMDLDRLQRELAGKPPARDWAGEGDEDYDVDDQYAAYADGYADWDDEENHSPYSHR